MNINNSQVIYGIDEVGRGAWAGPLFAAAVGLTEAASQVLLDAGLNDSKLLSAAKRQTLAALIRQQANTIIIKSVSVTVIDQHGVGAANAALFRALMVECPADVRLLADGRPQPDCERVEFIINGDASEPAIMAASIVAKVSRDHLMTKLATQYPAYGFDHHVGYGTKAHQLALETHGITPHHRQSFRPIQALQAKTIDL